MDGVAEKKAILDRYNELMMNYSDETAEEAAKLQDEIDAQNLWDLESQVEMAMDALGCPPGDADVDQALGRREAPRRALQAAARGARPAPPRRADQPSRRRDGRLAGKASGAFPGAVLIITHDRYFLDNVTGWILELDRGRGIPYEGNYTAYLEKKAKRLHAGSARGRAARQKVIEREREWMGRSPEARQAKSKARIKAYDELLKANEARLQSRDAQIVIPPGERLGDIVIDVDDLSKGYDGKLLIDDLSFKLPPGGIVGIIGPNGAGKTTLFRMITGQEKPDAGSDPRRRHGRARLCRPEPHARRRTRPSGRRSPAATRSSSSASAR